MKSSSFGYLIKEGARNVSHNRLMSTASIGVLTACLLLIGAAVLLTMNVNEIVGYVEDQNEAIVFLYDDADSSEIDEVENLLKSSSNIKKYEFVSREDGLKEQMALLGEEGELLSGFEVDNPLPDSFRIRIDDLSMQEETLEEIQVMSAVESISASADLASTITNIKGGVSAFGVMMVAIMAVVSFVIVANTVKVSIYARRKEISIMKYVGATDIFIKMPFVVEGILLGLISALLAFLITWGGYAYILKWFSDAPSSWLQMAYGNLINFKEIAAYIIGGYACAGVAIGGLGSTAFMGKFLKV